jgi:hypothetical protein
LIEPAVVLGAGAGVVSAAGSGAFKKLGAEIHGSEPSSRTVQVMLINYEHMIEMG